MAYLYRAKFPSAHPSVLITSCLLHTWDVRTRMQKCAVAHTYLSKLQTNICAQSPICLICLFNTDDHSLIMLGIIYQSVLGNAEFAEYLLQPLRLLHF